ncbi:FK506 binding protein 2 (predicted), isoform CRA_d [Rattus norvegicus]|uniref:FK506 binding protein 2 (Predicted), isoform CRA_d n=1 Tax=Rattus norvegicus TaxID=10116 RepID=A6HZK6_RAT|nr:FK506 binding protein 2 (predicted), isoform CRA_d [Rattus norvegicus]
MESGEPPQRYQVEQPWCLRWNCSRLRDVQNCSRLQRGRRPLSGTRLFKNKQKNL